MIMINYEHAWAQNHAIKWSTLVLGFTCVHLMYANNSAIGMENLVQQVSSKQGMVRHLIKCLRGTYKCLSIGGDRMTYRN